MERSERPSSRFRDTIVCRPDRSTLSVRHVDPDTSSVADAVRIRETVRIMGILRGAALDRTPA
jgi:hypothetical protein